MGRLFNGWQVHELKVGVYTEVVATIRVRTISLDVQG